MKVSATIKTVYCAATDTAQFREVSYEYTAEDDRLVSEKSALQQLLGGGFAKFPYPVEWGKNHLAVWRRAERCVVAASHALGGLQSLRDEEIGPVIGDIERNRSLFLPKPDDLLLRYLNTNEDIDAVTDEAGKRLLSEVEAVVGLEKFRHIRRLVLEHGRACAAQPLPSEFASGVLGTCHADSIGLALDRNLVYVEGFALIGPGRFALLHGWCIDAGGRVIDRTWNDRGTAYFGVPINPDYLRRKLPVFKERGNSVTGSVFNDPTDGWAILDGRTSVTEWKLS